MANVKNPCHSLTVNGTVGDLIQYQSTRYRNLVTIKKLGNKPVQHKYWLQQSAMQASVTYYNLYYAANKTNIDLMAKGLNIGPRQYIQKRLVDAIKVGGGWVAATDTITPTGGRLIRSFSILKTKGSVRFAWAEVPTAGIIGYWITLTVGTVNVLNPTTVSAWVTERYFETSNLTPGKTFRISWVAAIGLTGQALPNLLTQSFTT